MTERLTCGCCVCLYVVQWVGQSKADRRGAGTATSQADAEDSIILAQSPNAMDKWMAVFGHCMQIGTHRCGVFDGEG